LALYPVQPDYFGQQTVQEDKEGGILVNEDDKITLRKQVLGDFDFGEEDGNWRD
jgi:hypothetical protein